MKSLIKIFVLSLFIILTKANEECWAEKFGFKCCKDNHIDNVSDSDGDWAQENEEWCGLNDYQEKECWSEKFGFPCCPEYTKINYSDGDGDWHYNYATGEWCGIREPYASKCWAEKHGYECCLDNHSDYITDKYGKRWSEENGKKCGIATTQEIDYSSTAETCWTKSYKLISFYNCCKYDYINPNDDSSGFGKWFNFKVNGRTYNVCAMKNGYPYWNDRERYNETREQWNDFKSKWGEGKEIDANNFERLSVLPGEDETQLNFSWYSTTMDYSLIRFGTTKDLTEENEVKGTNYECKKIKETQYYCNQVTVIGLEPNSIYYYQRNLNGIWEEPIEFKTHDPYNFRFVFLGDPQLGASHNDLSIDKYIDDDESLRNDAFNWNMTIFNSYSKANEASLILSAGDNADSGQSPSDSDILRYPDELEYDLIKQEKEYSSLLLPELMQKVPFASAIGNHESFTASFRYHFNTPNSLKVESDNQIPGYDYASVTPGYSYFFKYNNVLIIVLESNYGTEEQYETLLEKACSTYPDVDWRIALFHHDIYSNGFSHSEEERVLLLRQWLTKLLYENKIDLVINGHEHIYSASHFISYDINNSNQYKYNITKIERNKIYKDHKGTMYITANCSTGSKLYKTKDYDMGYLYFYNQTYSSTFGILDFKNENGKVQMRITSYEVDTYNITDGPYIFEKDAKEIPFNTTTTTTNTTTTKPITTTTNIISTPESCWSLPDYPCCSNKNTGVVYTDNMGNWGIENGEWCGIIRESIENTCWSLPDYPCCSNKNTGVVYTDDNGNWGIEDENWCGIIRESIENTCWSLPDYSCCNDKNIDVVYTDNMGNWGIENGEWCGIIRESMEETCWSLPDYPCCNNKNIAVVTTDDKGNWGIENGEWCGILKE